MLPRLALPEWTVTFVVVVTLLGFPIALVMGWAHERGTEVPERVPPSERDALPTRAAAARQQEIRF